MAHVLFLAWLGVAACCVWVVVSGVGVLCENWIVDASDYVRFFLGFHVFAFTDFRPAPFWWSRLDRFVIV